MADPGGSSCRLRHHCARILMRQGSRFGKEDQRRASGSPAFSTCGYLRWGNAHRGGQDRRCRTSDHPDWVLRFNARGPDGLLDGKSTGQPCKLNDTQRQAIAGMIESGPIPAVHGVVRWRLIDLAQWIFEEFRITIAKQTLSRELRAM